MKKILKTLKGMLGFIIVGVTLGILFAVFEISPTSPYVILTIVVIVFIYYFYSFRKSWLVPVRLINQGKYDEAIEIMTKVEEKNKDTLGYRRQAVYNIAVCYTLKGEFQKSIDILDQIQQEKMDKNFKAGYLSVYASNVLAIEGNMELAEEYLDEASKVLNIPSILIAKAHIRLAQGDQKAANNLVQQALQLVQLENSKKLWIGWSALVIDSALNELTENYSLGTYYYKTANMERAQYYLSKAAEYPYENYYTAKANELLQKMTE